MLPKWPAMLVVGKRVTEVQAAQIIIRTSGMYFYTNDHKYEKLLYEAAGIKFSQEPFFDQDSVDTARSKYGCCDVAFLKNHRVVSCWIGGSYGWCDWDGTIGCNNFNIGKWPDAEEVLKEWQTIADAFPYLDLRCQLMSGESCEENTEPVVEYSVSEGEAWMFDPGDKLVEPVGITDEALLSRMNNPLAERGCDLDRFKWALKICEV